VVGQDAAGAGKHGGGTLADCLWMPVSPDQPGNPLSELLRFGGEVYRDVVLHQLAGSFDIAPTDGFRQKLMAARVPLPLQEHLLQGDHA